MRNRILIFTLWALTASLGAQEANPRVLILNLASEGGPESSGYLRKSVPNAVAEALQKTGQFQVLNRDLGSRLAKRQGIDTNDLANEKAVYQLGLSAKAGIVVFGSYSALDGVARIQLKSFDMKNRTVSVSQSKTHQLDNTIFNAISKMASSMADKMVLQKQQPRRSPTIKNFLIVATTGPGEKDLSKTLHQAMAAELFEGKQYNLLDQGRAEEALQKSGIDYRQKPIRGILSISDSLNLNKTLIAHRSNQANMLQLTLLDNKTSYVLYQRSAADQPSLVKVFKPSEFSGQLRDPIGLNLGLYPGAAFAVDTESNSLGPGLALNLNTAYLFHVAPSWRLEALGLFTALFQRESSEFLTETDLKIFGLWAGMGLGYHLPVVIPLYVFGNLYGGYSYTTLRRSFDTETFTGFAPGLRLEIEGRYFIRKDISIGLIVSYWQVFYSVDSLKQVETTLGARYHL